MDKIFFIIPVYRVEAYLKRCIESVLNQSYQHTEIILVDDGSPDNCPKICDEYAQKYENISVIHKPNGGLSDARNAGLSYMKERASAEDYIVLLDADDFVHERFCERMLALAKAYGCDMVQCDYEKGVGNTFGSNTARVKSFCVPSGEALLGYTLKTQCGPKLYKAKIFNDILFPVGMLNEDEFVTYRAVYSAKRIAFTNERLYYYFQHETSIMTTIAKRLKDSPHRYDFLKAYEARLGFFERENLPEQVQKTHEKVCTDIILRYCEQMYLPCKECDADCVNGRYMELYRKHFAGMIRRKKMPLKRRLMYISFYIFPYSAVLMGKIFTLRK